LIIDYSQLATVKYTGTMLTVKCGNYNIAHF